MEEKIKKRGCTSHNISLEGDQFEFDLELHRGASIVNLFWRSVEEPILLQGGRRQRALPVLIADQFPDEPIVVHRFALIPVDAVIGHPEEHVWKIIGVYKHPSGILLALYNIFTKD